MKEHDENIFKAFVFLANRTAISCVNFQEINREVRPIPKKEKILHGNE